MAARQDENGVDLLDATALEDLLDAAQGGCAYLEVGVGRDSPHPVVGRDLGYEVRLALASRCRVEAHAPATLSARRATRWTRYDDRGP